MPDYQSNPSILVTGGLGFLGKAITREMLRPDTPIKPGMIRILDISSLPESPESRIDYMQGDIRDYETVKQACAGINIVIHTAAIVDWGTKSEKEVYSVNVTGTENIIRACREEGVSCLVFTSSLDAVFAGKPLIDHVIDLLHDLFTIQRFLD